jgi:hypothetical protein
MAQEKKTSLTRRVARAGGWAIAKKLAKSIPFAGTAIAIGLAGQSIRKKGWVNGSLDAGLDAIPVVGTAKAVVEIFTGDFIPDKDPDGKSNRNGKK